MEDLKRAAEYERQQPELVAQCLQQRMRIIACKEVMRVLEHMETFSVEETRNLLRQQIVTYEFAMDEFMESLEPPGEQG